jgi:hypothetical protein
VALRLELYCWNDDVANGVLYCSCASRDIHPFDHARA